jgi:hypothetical protein
MSRPRPGAGSSDHPAAVRAFVHLRHQILCPCPRMADLATTRRRSPPASGGDPRHAARMIRRAGCAPRRSYSASRDERSLTSAGREKGYHPRSAPARPRRARDARPWRSGGQARPPDRRRVTIARPARVRIRWRNPWVFLRDGCSAGRCAWTSRPLRSGSRPCRAGREYGSLSSQDKGAMPRKTVKGRVYVGLWKRAVRECGPLPRAPALLDGTPRLGLPRRVSTCVEGSVDMAVTSQEEAAERTWSQVVDQPAANSPRARTRCGSRGPRDQPPRRGARGSDALGLRP